MQLTRLLALMAALSAAASAGKSCRRPRPGRSSSSSSSMATTSAGTSSRSLLPPIITTTHSSSSAPAAPTSSSTGTPGSSHQGSPSPGTTTTPGTATTPGSTGSQSTTSTTRSSTAAGPTYDSTIYIPAMLAAHNIHRANHSAAALTWSPILAATAFKIASTCVYGHDTSVDGGGYGQNIGAGWDWTTADQMVGNAMYNSEMASYTYYGAEPDYNTLGSWGHFTQIVWKGTAAVGCATADCSGPGLTNAAGIPPYFSVCNYAPAGNVVGGFAANVGPPLGEPDYVTP